MWIRHPTAQTKLYTPVWIKTLYKKPGTSLYGILQTSLAHCITHIEPSCPHGVTVPWRSTAPTNPAGCVPTLTRSPLPPPHCNFHIMESPASFRSKNWNWGENTTPQNGHHGRHVKFSACSFVYSFVNAALRGEQTITASFFRCIVSILATWQLQIPGRANQQTCRLLLNKTKQKPFSS